MNQGGKFKVAKKQSEILQGTEKEFLDVFKQMCYSRSPWEVWADRRKGNVNYGAVR